MKVLRQTRVVTLARLVMSGRHEPGQAPLLALISVALAPIKSIRRM